MKTYLFIFTAFFALTGFLWGGNNNKITPNRNFELKKNKKGTKTSITHVTEIQYLDDSYAKRVAKCTPATPGAVINDILVGAHDPQWMVQHEEDPQHWHGPYSGLTYVHPNTSFYTVFIHTDFANQRVNGHWALTGLRFNNKPRPGTGDDSFEPVLHILNWDRKACDVTVHGTEFGGPVYFDITVVKTK